MPPFGRDARAKSFVNRVLQARAQDFLSFQQEQAERLVDHAKESAG